MTLRNLSANLVDFYNQVPLNLPGHFELIGGKRHWLDPEDTVQGDGTILNPFYTLEGAESAITAGQGDIVIVRGIVNSSGSTKTATVAAAVDWDKNSTALIGACAPTLVAKRARIANAATSVALAYIIDVQAHDCVFENLHITNEGTTAASALGTMIVSGQRNYFKGLHIGQPLYSVGQATAYALKVTGSENTFEDCVIGLDTVKRTADNAVMILDGAATRNTFINCRFVSHAEVNTYCMVRVADSTALDRLTVFQDCTFYNFWTNWGGTLLEAFEIPAGMQTNHILWRGQNSLVGILELDANDRSGTYQTGPAAAAASGIAVTPTT